MPFADLKRNGRMVRETLKDAGVVDTKDDESLDGVLGSWAGSWEAGIISSQKGNDHGRVDAPRRDDSAVELEDLPEDPPPGQRSSSSRPTPDSTDKTKLAGGAHRPNKGPARTGRGTPGSSHGDGHIKADRVPDYLLKSSGFDRLPKHVASQHDPRQHRQDTPAVLNIASSVTEQNRAALHLRF